MTGPARRRGPVGSGGAGSAGGAGTPRRAAPGNAGAGNKRRGLESIADLLPQAAREYGLEDQLEQARTAAAWLEVVAERVPAAAGSCRLIALDGGAATVEADEPIVAQEIRLRAPELLAALRGRVRGPLRQIRVVARHV
jgi:hypothetical protein